jgi:cell division protein FtsB
MTKLDESLDKDEVIQALKKENEALKNENKALTTQIEFQRGGPVVELIREWTGGWGCPLE